MLTFSAPLVAVAGGTISTGLGGVSSLNWHVENSVHTGNSFDYAFFARKIPSNVIKDKDSDTSLNQSDLISNGDLLSSGYRVHYISSDVTISDTGDISIGDNKVIVVVDGKVDISNKISLNAGKGFFMLVASGDITIGVGVGDAVVISPLIPDDDIEGIFYSGGSFETGLGSATHEQLVIRGIVASERIELGRYQVDSGDGPAEIFRFAPDLIMNFPNFFSTSEVKWAEVGP